MGVGKWHILGPEAHVSIASLVGRILARAWRYGPVSAGRFGQILLFFAIVCHIGTTISPWGTGSSRKGRAIIVAYDKGLYAIEFRICSSGPSRVIQLLVRSMIPPCAPHAAFCPLRAVIPSVNSKQPV